MAVALRRNELDRGRETRAAPTAWVRAAGRMAACARTMHAGGYLLPIAVSLALVAVQFTLQGWPIRPLAWPVVALEAIAIASAIAVASLAAPRGWTLRDRFQVRLATTFAVLAVNGAFFILTYPGLRDGDALGGAGLLADGPLPSWYFAVLDLWILPIGVALAAHGAGRPASDASAARHVAVVVAMVALGTAIVAAGQAGSLPDAFPAPVPPYVRWTVDHATHLVVAIGLWRLWPLATGPAASSVDTSRQWLARALVWCLALRLASMIGAEVEAARYEVGWYAFRVARTLAFASVVVALVRDGVRLFRVERERTHYWQEVSCGLSGVGMAATVTAMREEATSWLERVFGASVSADAASVVGARREQGRRGNGRVRDAARCCLDLPALRDPASGATLQLVRARPFSGTEREAIDAFLSGATLSIQRARDAERAAAVKDEFLTMIGHELRTPLTSVVGYGNLLADILAEEEGTSADARDISGRLRFHADDLSRLIDAMLVTSHDLGGVTLPPMEAVDLAGRARVVVDGHQAEAARRGLRVAIDPPPEPLRAWCAPVLLDRMLAILVENAIRYTPAGGHVTVRFDHAAPTHPLDAIVAGTTCGHSPMVACTVRDSGRGLPDGASARLFEPFFRQEGADVQRERGAGLGLYQARRMVELMHGRVEARDHGGEGASFTIVLPAA